MLGFIRPELQELVAYATPPEQSTDNLPEQVDYLDTNEFPLDLPPELKQKLAHIYTEIVLANRYPDSGQFYLKQAIATYVNEQLPPHQSLTTASISVGSGSDELIRSILLATCVNGQGSILVAEPTFSMYAILAQSLGIPVERVGRDEDAFAVDLKAAQGIIEQGSVRVVFMLQPNSPTGNALTAAEVAWLETLPAHILVVIDEAYFEFCGQSLVARLADHPNWLILRTFSKALRLAAHRVGYGLAQPELIAILEKLRLPYNLSAYSQVAAQFALDHRQALLGDIPQVLAERDRLYQSLKSIPQVRVWPSVGNFLFLRLGEPEKATALRDTLQHQGTLVRAIADGIRLSVGTPAENDRLLTRINEYFASP
ncbi:histidinol-phosphate transaminase [Candidatus Synechococcus calcipolaris G9]|uniref:Histidinol-phosphate aminotransferase n=1 Tax=Candidatus Synechococcus calcipolaris G9 TaxID=1497997 RepID=A0ABT6EV89_9SYNE|nr:histidinol-phosphate transaminase [Candidatus Synechococcus calcipolaris]MDG2989732.1 histidinol-phosphate transaminase [Candidatus Synechococcus calcipolaris G9]